MANDTYLNYTRLRQFYNKLKTVFATKSDLTNIKGEKGDKGDKGSVETIQASEPTTQNSGDFWLQEY